MNIKSLKYRYALETYDPKVRKHICPACRKRPFVRYVDLESGEYVSTDVGRCDREEKCGYHKKPRDYFEENNLISFIKSRWGKDAVQKITISYQIGTCRFWPGATIFWQQDSDGRFRTGKIMLYNRENGHRIKDPISRIMWVHKLPIFSDFNLKQCLFGESHAMRSRWAPETPTDHTGRTSM